MIYFREKLGLSFSENCERIGELFLVRGKDLF